MLDRLIDLILSSIRLLSFFTVIDEFEEAVVLRFGKFNRKLGPGFHLLWPFNIETVLTDNVVARTTNLPAQSLTTADGHTVVVSGVVTSRITDIQKALLEVEGVDHALLDSCIAEIARQVSRSTWDELRNPEFSDQLTKSCRRQGFKYGIEILRVQLSDVTKARSLRLWMEPQHRQQ